MKCNVGVSLVLLTICIIGIGWLSRVDSHTGTLGGQLLDSPSLPEGPFISNRYANLHQQRAYRTSSSADLQSSSWKLTWLPDKSDIIDMRSSEIYIHLTAEGGTVQGFAGCNRLRGRYELGENTLRFSDLALTRKACIEEIMERERALLNALENSEKWNIRGNQLELLNRNNEVLARLQARD